MEMILKFVKPPQQSIYEPGISSECYRLCRELIMGLDKDEFDEDELHQGKMAENRGTVLCFLPGDSDLIFAQFT